MHLFFPGIRNYLTKFLSDDWMKKKGFLDEVIKRDTLFPKETFEIKEIYNPELSGTEHYQTMTEPWPVKLYNPDRPMLINTIDEAIGWSPMIKLNKLTKNIEAEVRKSFPHPESYCF